MYVKYGNKERELEEERNKREQKYRKRAHESNRI